MGLLGNAYRVIRFKIFNKTNLSLRHLDFFVDRTAQLKTDRKSRIVFEGRAILHRNVFINMDEGAECIIENNVYFGDGSIVRGARCKVSIGADTIIGQCVKILATNHRYLDPTRLIREQDIDTEKNGVNIGRDCWIGAGSIIVAGVNIGDGAVVGAGSIVTKSVPEYTVVAGNPAKFMRKRTLQAREHQQ